MTTFLIALLTGFGLGSVYALVALGFSFGFRTTGGFNFAQGQMVTFGSLFAYTFFVGGRFPAVLAAICAVLIVGAIGGLTERIAIWPLARRREDTLKWLMSTLGMAVLFTGAAERIWGTQPLGVRPYVSPAIIHFGQVTLPVSLAMAFGVAVLSATGIELFQRYTLTGRVLRAVGENRSAVELAGVNVLGLGFVAFVIGGALAGIAGFIVAPVTFADPTAGFNYVILAFTAVAIGGFASHWGALVGGWAVGITGELAGIYLGLQYQNIAVFVMLVLILCIRPEGITTRRLARQV